jgi:ATP synthase F1 delta subunit
VNPENASLVKKYGTALLNVAGKQFDEQEFERTKEVATFLIKHKEIVLFLNMPVTKKEVLNQALATLFDGFNSADLFKKLVIILAKKKRSLILPDVLNSIIEQYQESHNRVQVVIRTYPAVDSVGLATLVQFARNHLKKTISYDYLVDPALIAGIRIQSNAQAWEYSIKKQLEKIVELQEKQWN